MNGGRSLDGRSLGRRESLQLGDFVLRFLPYPRFLLGRIGSARVAVERENVLAQFRSDLVEVFLCKLIEQVRVGVVGKNVFAGVSHAPGVEVGVGKAQFFCVDFPEKALVVIQSVIDAGDVKIFGFMRGDFEIEGFERPDFGHELQKERQQAGSESRTAISLAPFFLIVGARKVVAKFSGIEIRRFGDDLLFARDECDSASSRE